MNNSEFYAKFPDVRPEELTSEVLSIAAANGHSHPTKQDLLDAKALYLYVLHRRSYFLHVYLFGLLVLQECFGCFQSLVDSNLGLALHLCDNGDGQTIHVV